jgi:hypothetical protein
MTPPNNGLGSRYRDFEEGGQGHKKTRAEKSDEDGDVIEILFDDAFPDSLHHMIALEHRPQGGENGHQCHSRLEPYEPASHGSADAVGGIVCADVPAHIRTGAQQD